MYTYTYTYTYISMGDQRHREEAPGSSREERRGLRLPGPRG